jgi:hypothetical protein
MTTPEMMNAAIFLLLMSLGCGALAVWLNRDDGRTT